MEFPRTQKVKGINVSNTERDNNGGSEKVKVLLEDENQNALWGHYVPLGTAHWTAIKNYLIEWLNEQEG